MWGKMQYSRNFNRNAGHFGGVGDWAADDADLAGSRLVSL